MGWSGPWYGGVGHNGMVGRSWWVGWSWVGWVVMSWPWWGKSWKHSSHISSHHHINSLILDTGTIKLVSWREETLWGGLPFRRHETIRLFHFNPVLKYLKKWHVGCHHVVCKYIGTECNPHQWIRRTTALNLRLVLRQKFPLAARIQWHVEPITT